MIQREWRGRGKGREGKEKGNRGLYRTGKGPQGANGPRELINPSLRIIILGELPLLTVNMTNFNQNQTGLQQASVIVADPTEGKNDN